MVAKADKAQADAAQAPADGQADATPAGQSPFDGLAAGRIVHYVLGDGFACRGECRPAMVGRRSPVNVAGRVDLVVTLIGTVDDPYLGSCARAEQEVDYSSGNQPGSWHWPRECPAG